MNHSTSHSSAHRRSPSKVNNAPNSDLRGVAGPDPMLMRNQRSLQSSSGTIWIVFGAFVLVAVAVAVGLLAVTPGRPSALVALITVAGVAAMYLALCIVRFVGEPGPTRLRRMAGCFLAMLGIGLLGSIAVTMLEWSVSTARL